MSKINAMLDVGKRSLMNSQTALQTVGHNIASKSTEGYSRQRAEQVTNVPISEGNYRIGQGARVTSVTRVNNAFLEKQIGKEEAQLGYLGGKQDAMTQVETVYNEQINKGLNQFMGDFYNAFRELSNNPESTATRTMVRETGDFLSKDFKRVNSQLKDIQKGLDQQVGANVSEINGITKEIGSLNQKIQMVELAGTSANDERDRRDLLIKKLGDKINIRWAEGADNTVTITAGNNALLVSGDDVRELAVAPSPESETKGEGNFDIYYYSNERAAPVKVTDQMTGGSVGGMLEVRDHVINDLRSDVDEMAYTLSTKVNEAHRLGYNAYNEKGVDFFEMPAGVRHASENLKVNKAVMDDVGRIAAAARPDAPGDNRVANYIASLQYGKVMRNGQSSMDDFYNGMVGRVGILTQRTNTAQQAQKDIVKQLGNIRESISGVSLDEETTKMIEFQKSFDASARLIKTADEMFDTVLNLKKL
jgi:flagellar hook-associated protein 1 FlgK